jgi:osmotically-inducible protein OsmY
MRTIVAVAAMCAMSVAYLLSRSQSETQALEARAASSSESGSGEVSPVAFQSSEDVKRAADIRTVILEDKRVAGFSDQVTIVVRGGHVTLQGRAPNRELKQAVEEDARSVPGVEQVENLLVVPGG